MMPASIPRVAAMASLALAIVAALGDGTVVSASALDARGSGRGLAEVLQELRASGLDINYSDELVRPEMRVWGRPRSSSPRHVLEEVLAPHGLEARRGPGGRLLVVKALAPRVRPRPPNRGTRAEMKLVIRSGRDEQPMRLTVCVPAWSFKRTTDAEGRVRMTVPPGTYDAEAWLPGYLPWQVDGLTAEAGKALEVQIKLVPEAEVDSRAAGAELLLTLRERYRYEETVEVLAEPVPSGGPASFPVTPLEVKKTAGAFENVFRTLSLLPGVTPVNEIQSRVSVRGGGPDQNLTIVDGVEVYNPFRLEALVSAFNPETVQSFELTTGIMSPRHGDRLSSALEVRTRPGSSSGVEGTAALSLTDTNVVLEGPLPRTRTGSWLLSGRRTYYEWIAAPIAKTNLPGFQDVQFRIDWPWSARAVLSVWGLHSRESAQLRDDLVPYAGAFADRPEWIEYGGRNDVFGATFRAPLAGRLSSTTTLSLYRNPQDGAQGEAILPDRPESVARYERHVRIEDMALRQAVLFQASPRSRWETGFEVHRLDTRWAMKGRGELATLLNFRGPSLAPTPWGSRGHELDEVVFADTRRRATRWGTWLQGTLEPSSRLILQPGLRIERSSVNHETVVLPRLAATWQLGLSTRLGAALGWHAQSPGFEKVVLADSFLDFGGSEPLALRSERSRNAALSLEHDFASGLAARVELYRNSFDRLIVGRLETEDERLRRLTGYEIPQNFPGGPPLDPLITAVPVNGGRGTARGLEVSLFRRGATSSKLTGALSYSYGVARREAYGYVHPFDYDRRHGLTATADLQVSRRFGLSAAWRAASGLPYTPFRPVVSFGLEQRLDQPPRRTPERGWFGSVPPPDPSGPDGWSYLYEVGHGRLSDLNAARHPFYSRVDFRARFNPSWGGGRWEFYLDVFNLLASRAPYRSNGPFFVPDLYRDPATGEFRVAETRLEGQLRPIIPSLGVRVRF